MPTPQTSFYLAPNLAIHLSWSACTTAFTQKWRYRFQIAEVSGAQVEEHVVEAAPMVLNTVEHLDDYTTQVLNDLYRLSGQLPAPTDKLIVGPLELRVDERQFAMNYQGDTEQVDITYYFDTVRYRYETAQPMSLSAISFSLPA